MTSLKWIDEDIPPQKKKLMRSLPYYYGYFTYQKGLLTIDILL